jgi:hypothetical protein
MVLFQNDEKLKATNIIIKNPIYLSEIYRVRNIKYKINNTNEDIYIQTPYMYLKYLPSTMDNNIESKYTLDLYLNVKKNIKKIKKDNSFQTSEDENEYDINIKHFYDFIKKIHKIIKTKLIKKNINVNIKNKIIEDYIDCIKEKDTINKDYKTYCFRSKIHSMNKKPYYKLYDSNKNLLSNESLKINKLSRFILKLDNIWYYENTYGFNWYIVQAEIKLPFNFDNYYFNYNTNIIQSPRQSNIPRPPPLLSNLSNSVKTNIINDTYKNNINTNNINRFTLTATQLLGQLNKLKKINK